MLFIELDELLDNLLFDEEKTERASTLIPDVLDKISKDLEIPLLYMDYCKINRREGKKVYYEKKPVKMKDVTLQGFILSLLVVFEDSNLIDFKTTIQDYIMDKLS
jgi:hypothetical protein